MCLNLYPPNQIRKRRIYRLAQILHDHQIEGSGMDTRYFDHPFIHDTYTILGKTTVSASYREHLVPRVYLRDRCLDLFRSGESVEYVSELIDKYLWIALLEPEQASRINKKYMSTMPSDWAFGQGDVRARLSSIGLSLL